MDVKCYRLPHLLLTFFVIFAANQAVANIAFPPPLKTSQDWFEEGHSTAKSLAAHSISDQKAKNIILFIGDGMGISTITAARILAGQTHSQSGEEYRLSFENFPFSALSKTYNTDQQVPDSAGTMSAVITGIKTKAGVLSIGPENPRGAHSNADNHTLKTLIESAEEWNYATGIVTNTRITHATPAACFAHSPHRNWEDDSKLPPAAKADNFADIARQLVDFSYGDGIEIILGGGKRHFLPTNEGGKRKDGHNLLANWQSRFPDGQLIDNANALVDENVFNASHVMGLFSDSHMDYEADRRAAESTQPSLTTMTEQAIKFLQRQQKVGYVLVVESGRIDHAHHDGNAYRALTETIELSNAVKKAKTLTSEDDTLIIVTADHSHVFTMGGYPVRGNSILGHSVEWNDDNQQTLAKDEKGLPYTTLAYTNGPGHIEDRHSHALKDPSAPDYKQYAGIPVKYESHSGEDVPIYASGPGSSLFRGVLEQNVIYHVMRQAMQQ